VPADPLLWREVRRVDVTGSTNADLAALAAEGEPAGLVLVAGEQTAGRGRLGRTWSAPAGTALTFSVLLRPAVPANRLGWLPLATGLAVADAVRSTAGLGVGLKWPNDVLAGDRKLGGILVERVGGTDAAVVGIGLNVAMRADLLPVPSATSLAVELAPAAAPRLDDLLDAVLGRLAERYLAWEAGTEQSGDYRAACLTLGRTVRVDVPAGAALTGTAVDVDEDGRLLVETDGGVQAVAAGDVVHVR
jgi:BirA family transcriptional regulator, biotin operon repressor / biotin---[acetyl-CoA-carboxylase] ligase